MLSRRAAKAYTAAAAAGIAYLAPVAADGVQLPELLLAAGLALAAFQATYWVSNGKPAEQGDDPPA